MDLGVTTETTRSVPEDRVRETETDARRGSERELQYLGQAWVLIDDQRSPCRQPRSGGNGEGQATPANTVLGTDSITYKSQ